MRKKQRILAGAVALGLVLSIVLMACVTGNYLGDLLGTDTTYAYADEDGQEGQLTSTSQAGNSESLGFGPLKSGDASKPFLTKKEIAKLLADTDNSKMDATDRGENIMEVQPSFTSPYSVGKLKKEALTLATARTNAIRKIAGLNPVTHNQQWSDATQNGAYISAFMQKIGHGTGSFPKKDLPSDFPDSIYKYVETYTNPSNLMLRPDPSLSIDRYMSDLGNPKVGHRVWILNQSLKEVGFGFSAGPEKPLPGKNTNFGSAVMYMSAKYNPFDVPFKEYDWDFVSWPPAGYFPANHASFDNRHFADKKRWSCLLNPEKYRLFSGNTQQTKVVLERIDRDGNVIVLNGAEQKVTLSNNTAAGLFIGTAEILHPERLSNGGSIPRDPVIFHESVLGEYKAGDRFRVTIAPVGDVQKIKAENADNYDVLMGKYNTSLSYIVEFFDINNP